MSVKLPVYNLSNEIRVLARIIQLLRRKQLTKSMPRLSSILQWPTPTFFCLYWDDHVRHSYILFVFTATPSASCAFYLAFRCLSVRMARRKVGSHGSVKRMSWRGRTCALTSGHGGLAAQPDIMAAVVDVTAVVRWQGVVKKGSTAKCAWSVVTRCVIWSSCRNKICTYVVYLHEWKIMKSARIWHFGHS